MTDIFTKKSAWFDFAKEHNKMADPGAVTLNGSESYTLASMHVASGKAIPASIRLDTARTKGVADHFNGLRKFYESGIESKRWLPSLVDQFRVFAIENSLDPDELIRKIITLTDRSTGGGQVVRVTEILSVQEQMGQGSYLPGKEDFESAYRRVSRLGEVADLDAVLDQIETDAANGGLKLQNDWRAITEENIEIWTGHR